MNLATGAQDSLKSADITSSVTDDGNLITLDRTPTGTTVSTSDLNGNVLDKVEFPVTYTVLGDYIVDRNDRSTFSRTKRRTVCPHLLPVNCDTCSAPFTNTNMENLSQIGDKMNCELPLTDKAWEATQSEKPNLTKLDILKYLSRFQKWGGFDLDAHFSILYTAGELSEHDPAIAKEYYKALAVMEVQNSDYRKIENSVRHNSNLRNNIFKPNGKPEDFCLSLSEKNTVISDFSAFLPASTVWGGWTSVKRTIEETRPLWSLLSSSAQDKAYNLIEDGLANQFDGAYPGFFRSTIVNLIDSNLDEALGIRVKKPVSDVQLIRSENLNDPDFITIVANSKFSSGNIASSEDGSGLQVLSIPISKSRANLKPGETLFQGEIPYDMSGSKMVAKVTINGLNKRPDELLFQGKKLDYNKMWTNGVRTGMIMFASNLEDFTDTVKDSFLEYYINNNFKFEKPVTGKSKEFILGRIASGEVNYFLKEGHAHGDSRDIVEMSSDAVILKGTRNIPGSNKQEVVYLVVSKQQKSKEKKSIEEQVIISAGEMGKAVQKHDHATNNSPLAYINTSCWSLEKIPSELEEIQSKNFLDIGSPVTVSTFVNNRALSGMYQVLDGIRHEKTFAQMSQGVKSTYDYIDGQSHFIFPTDPEYDQIRMRLSVPISQKIEITKNGVPYTIGHALSE